MTILTVERMLFVLIERREAQDLFDSTDLAGICQSTFQFYWLLVNDVYMLSLMVD